MAKKGTGLEKFMQNQFGDAVPIRTLREDNSAIQERTARREKAADEERQGRGRPALTEKPEMAPIMFKIDRNLKIKLETVKHITYKSSLKDVIVEALYDIVEKYGVK